MFKAFILVAALSIIAHPVTSMELEQNGTNCELIAKHYARLYEMDMYLILPLKDNGAVQTGLYSGHWINSKAINGNRYFFEMGGSKCPGCGTETIMNSIEAARTWYRMRYARDCVIYAQNEIPFKVVYHYD